MADRSGFVNGANKYESYKPIISSYDYDSRLDEAGRPTEKLFVLHDVIKKHLPAGATLPEIPSPPPMIEIPRFTLKGSANLFSALGQPISSERPQPMEALGQHYGLILYRKKLSAATKST